MVVGAGSVVVGDNQTQAAAEWDSRLHYCGTVGAFQDVGEITCPANPYAGGEGKIGLGIVLVLVGGVSVRAGET